jgi:hypothetical protein
LQGIWQSDIIRESYLMNYIQNKFKALILRKKIIFEIYKYTDKPI